MSDRFPVSGTAPTHPADELLVAYLTHTLDDSERANLEEHLRICDDCVQSLPAMRHLLTIIDETPAQIPERVRQRATELAQQIPTTVETPIADPTPWNRGTRKAWVLDWLASMLRLPVLVPVAAAALAVLVVMNRQAWFNPAQPGDLTRSLEVHETLHVTSSEAVVWAQPGGGEFGQNRVMAKLQHGEAVDIVEGKDNWYRVVLSNKQEGWVERRAFE